MDCCTFEKNMTKTLEAAQNDDLESESSASRASAQTASTSSASSLSLSSASSREQTKRTVIRKSPVFKVMALITSASSSSNERPLQARGKQSAQIPTDQTLVSQTMSSSSESSTFKRYKFGLNNHFLTMPHMDHAITSSAMKHQLDAKVYQDKYSSPSAVRPTERMSNGEEAQAGKKTAISAQTKASVDKYLKSISVASEQTNLDGLADLQRHQEEGYPCDLSVLAPSSARVLSLSMASDDDDDVDDNRELAADQRARRNEKRVPNTKVSEQTQQHLSTCNDLAQTLSRSKTEQYFSPAQSASELNTSDAGLTSHPLEYKQKKQHELASSGDDCVSNSVLIRFSSIMYATFLVVLGCIFHVSELRQQSKNSSDHIYTTIVALVGIAWLLFLQSDLQRYKRYASKFILIESIFNDQIKLQQASGSGQVSKLQLPDQLLFSQFGAAPAGGSADPSARSISSSSASLINDRMSMNTELIFKRTAYKMYEQQFRQQEKKLAGFAANGGAGGSNGGSCEQIATSELSPKQRTRCANMTPAYKFLHGKMGANFYLKCGMAAFCFGSVIHEGLRFGQQLYFFATGNLHCRDSAALVAHLVTPLYSFYQLFMMFKYSNLVINRHKILARFGLMHIIGTCVTFWFRTILEEAFEDFVHKMDYFKAQNKPLSIDASMFTHNQQPSPLPTPVSLASADQQRQSFASLLLNSLLPSETTAASNSVQNVLAQNSSLLGQQSNASLAHSALLALMSSPISATITPQLVRHLPESYACAQNTLLTTKSMNALPYLYPFTIEYNLLIAATFLSLYFNIGKTCYGPSNGSQCASLAAGAASATKCQPGGGARRQPLGERPAVLQQPTGDKLHSANRWPSGASLSSVLLGHSMDQQQLQCAPSEHSSRYLRRSSLGAAHAESGMHYNGANYSPPSRQGQLDVGSKNLGEYKSNFVVNADCHAANKGLFCGFFVLLVTLVTIVIFFVTINKPSHVQLGIKINLIQEATLTGLILIVTLAAFRQIMRLNRNTHLKDKVTTDDVLMLIPLPFFFIHSLLSFRAETASLYSSQATAQQQNNQQQQSPAGGLMLLRANSLLANNLTNGQAAANGAANQLSKLLMSLPSNETPLIGNSVQRNSSAQQRTTQTNTLGHGAQNKVDYFKLLTVALNLGVMIEVLVQTNFIIDGLRRCSESRYLRFKKPGRELITFAILLNITYWIVATFETKSVEQYKTEIEYYGPLPYMFISHTTLPVMLFYRYHSSVCLAEIWNRAYKPPK